MKKYPKKASDMDAPEPRGEAHPPEPAETGQPPEVKEDERSEAQESERVAPVPDAADYDALMDRLKRVTADYINSQKRLEREMNERCDYAIEVFARDLLLVADDLARAVAAAREHNSAGNILEGLQIVEDHLYAALKRHGVTPLDTQPGHLFDPDIHEAISAVESDEYEPNRIVQAVQKGFRIHKRLLRPARVVVSAELKHEPEKGG